MPYFVVFFCFLRIMYNRKIRCKAAQAYHSTGGRPGILRSAPRELPFRPTYSETPIYDTQVGSSGYRYTSKKCDATTRHSNAIQPLDTAMRHDAITRHSKAVRQLDTEMWRGQWQLYPAVQMQACPMQAPQGPDARTK